MARRTENPGKLPRILIIDDEIAYTFLLKTALEETGPYEVEICNDPMEALPMCRQFRPDVILLDVIMPRINGGEVKTLLERDPDLRDITVVMVTALVSRNEISEKGFVISDKDLMIPKPISAKGLHFCLTEILAFNRMNRNR